MAKLIVEEREFKDRDTGIVTNYKYYAISGKIGTQDYEVPLKNLVGAEKTALEMLAAAEQSYTSIESRKATKNEEDEFFEKNKNDSDDFNLDED